MSTDPDGLRGLIEAALAQVLAGEGTAAPIPRTEAAAALRHPALAEDRRPKPGLARWLQDLELPDPVRLPPPFRRPSLPSATPPGPGRPHGIGSPRRPEALQAMLAASPARLGVGRAGTRCRTRTVLDFLADHAVALDAVASLLPADFAARHGLLEVRSRVADHQEYLLRPDLGRLLAPDAPAALAGARRGADVQVVVGDGLSAAAVEQQWPRLAGPLSAALAGVGLSTGTPVLARFARVMLQDRICEATGAKACVLVIGERPGLGGGDGVSAYVVYQPGPGTTDADKNMIPNICDWGTPPDAAAAAIARMVRAMFDQGLSGTLLKLD